MQEKARFSAPDDLRRRPVLSPRRDDLSPCREIALLAIAVVALSATGCDGRAGAEEPPAAPVIMVHETAPAAPAAGSAALPTCDGPAGEHWIREFRDRVVRHGEFARFAATRFGEPTSCRGAITAEFDGLEFGTLHLGYAGGAELVVETMPAETSVTTLRVPGGFGSDDEALDLLRRSVDRRGLELDWSRPQSMTVDGRETIFFEHPDPGFNATARMIRSEGAVRTLEFSLAL